MQLLARLIYMPIKRCPLETVSLATSHFRALDSKMSRLAHYRCVLVRPSTGDVLVDSARDNRRAKVRPRHEVPSQARGHQDAHAFFRPRVEPHVRCAIKVQSGLIERNLRRLLVLFGGAKTFLNVTPSCWRKCQVHSS